MERMLKMNSDKNLPYLKLLTSSPSQYFILVLLTSGSIYFIALITDIFEVLSNIQGLFLS